MKRFRLPSKFELGGQTITVILKDGMSKNNAHGLSHYDAGEIWFDNQLKPEDLKGITFYHELMHFIFNTLGQETLRDNEGLVDSIGNLLYQAHKTMEFDK